MATASSNPSSNQPRRKRNTRNEEDEHSIKKSMPESKRKVSSTSSRHQGREQSRPSSVRMSTGGISRSRTVRPLESSIMTRRQSRLNSQPDFIPLSARSSSSSLATPTITPSYTSQHSNHQNSTMPSAASSSSSNGLDALFELSPDNNEMSSLPPQTTPPPPRSTTRPPLLDDLFIIDSSPDNVTSDDNDVGNSIINISNGSSENGGDDDHDVIIVGSDDEDEDVIVTRQTTLSRDELMARRLQAQYNSETNRPETFGNGTSTRSMMTSNEPSGNGGHGSEIIRDNMDALATRIDNWTAADARRFLMVTIPPGRRGNQRTIERHLTRTNPMVLYAAIMGGPAAVPMGVSSMGSYEDLLELAEQLGPARSSGFSDEAIKSIKKKRFKPGCSSTKEDSKQNCVICMSEFESNEMVKSLSPCKHDFHSKCIDPWLKQHKTCPICRSNVQLPKK